MRRQVRRVGIEADAEQHVEACNEAQDARMRALADALPQMVWTFSSLDGAATYTNRRFREYYGSIDAARRERVRLNHPDDAARMEAAWTEAVRLGEPYAVEGRLRRRDGTYRWHKLVIAPVTRGGRIVEWLATALDIDEILLAREKLAETTTILELAQGSAGAGLWEWDMDKDVVRHSAASARMHGRDVDEGETLEMSLRQWQACVHPEDLPAISSAARQAMAAGSTFAGEFRTSPAAGERARILQAFGQVICDKGTGRPIRLVGLHLDVTAQREAEASNRRLSLQDPLTGLANRHALGEHLNRCCLRADAGTERFALFTIDLDRFKAINDTFGHPTGDTVLVQIGERIRGTLEAGDLAARLGGDEFMVILAGIADRAAADRAAARLIKAICMPLDIDDRSFAVDASMGVALTPGDGRAAEDLFKRADIALFKAKAAGRSQWVFYEAGMEAELAERNLLALDMRDALRDGAFALHYQPIINVRSGQVSCCEALLRWTHPIRGPVSPASFVPIAEETGLIVQLGAWALRHACREAATWPEQIRVAVNVSAVQFRQPGFEQVVLNALAASGLAADRLELEITESVLIAEDRTVLAILRKLEEIGVRVALDDFGTGFSSLAYLERFPFDKIKIDRSFIRGLGDKRKAAIVRAIVGIGASLDIPITAEGVETDGELRCVVAEGCDEIQGFLYSRPLQRDALRAYLQASGAQPRSRPAG